MSWWVLSAFMGTAIVGVVVYLNLRAGPSFGYGVLPEGALREARERDYFFTWGFVCWGLWAGWGAVSLAERIRRYSWLAVLAPCVPLLLNWSAIRTARVDEQQAAASRSRAALEALPPRAVMLAAGDNDTYLLWYWQSVHAVRRDVTVVTIPLLGAGWYRTELARRGGLMPQSLVTTWRGEVKTVEAVRQAADRAGRPVVTSAMTGAYW